MIEYQEALRRVLENVPARRTVEVPLKCALGCVLAENVRIDIDLPPFRKAFMDGYALRSSDIRSCPAILEVIGESAAGRPFEGHVEEGQAVRISTGAAIPEGANAVQMVEKTRLKAGRVEILEPVLPNHHIGERGSEVLAGSQVLNRGQRLGSAHVGVLATAGRVQLRVYRRPRITILVTGDELVDVTLEPRFGQIRNSNGPMLAARCYRLGVGVGRNETVADSPEAVAASLRAALSSSDAVLCTGGVSMGERDYVKNVVKEADLDILFHRVSIKPGKPVLAAANAKQMVFGLPGNPVSALVTFEVLVRPALEKWAGGAPQSHWIDARLRTAVKHSGGRLFFKPARARLEEGRFEVEPLETSGSADLVAFARCNALMILAPESGELKAGSRVKILLLEADAA